MTLAESWTEELNCAICLDFFTDPVSLGCGHTSQENRSCPECRQVTAERKLQVNRALAKMVEKARGFSLEQTQTSVRRQCEKHREDLKLFCETDQKLICSICRGAKEHRGHSFLPIDEAAEIYKVPINSRGIHSVSTSCFHVKHFYFVRLFQDQAKSSLASLTQRKEKALQAEAKQREKIHKLRYLTDREQRVMCDLKQREEEVLLRMETNLREIKCKLDSVEQELSELQTQMGKDALTFLQVKR
uniref:RING-type E3 ubiquitin transferase n=1 Tax=Callorhinchus milii TaxID=7868 RepID=A0A4W3GHA4_CALMI